MFAPIARLRLTPEMSHATGRDGLAGIKRALTLLGRPHQPPSALHDECSRRHFHILAWNFVVPEMQASGILHLVICHRTVHASAASLGRTRTRFADLGVPAVRRCARSDAGGKVLLSWGHNLCGPDRIVIERDLCRPVPVAGAKAHLELPRTRRGDRVPGAMAVYEEFRFREELKQ